MADQPVNIPINVTRGNLSGIDDLERRLNALRDKFAGVQQAYRQIGQQVATLGSTPGALSLSQLGFEQTASGIRRAGYTGGLPPAMPAIPPPMGYTYVRPGGVRPMPAGLGAPAARPGSAEWLAAHGYVSTAVPADPLGRRLTRLQAAHLLEQQNVATAQRFESMQRAAAVQAQLPQTQLQMITAGMLTGTVPGLSVLQMAHAAQFGAPQTPLQQAHALMQAQQQAQRQSSQQQAMQHAQLVSLVAQMGPQPRQPGVGSAVGGAIIGAMTGGGGTLGTIGGIAGSAFGVPGMIIGSLIGKGLDRGIGMGMQGLETQREKEVSILRLGDTLNQQFSTLRHTVTLLRRDFQVLGQESVPAMLDLARATGLEERALVGVAHATIGAGRYAGMTATESMGLVTQMYLSGATSPNLRAALAIGHEAAARYPGAISPARFAMETGRAMQVGGLGFAPMSEEFAGRNVEFMMGMGGRYATQPAAAIAQRAVQMGRPQSTVGQVLQISALDRLRQRQRYVTLPDGMVLDLNDPEDMRIAAENIYQIPEAREAVRQEVVLNAPGNTSLQRRFYGEATASPSAYQTRREWAGTQREALRYGSVTNALQRPADIAAQRAREAARRAGEVGEPGLTELQRRTVPEEIAETVPMRAFEEARSRMQIAFGQIAEQFNNGLTTTQTYFQLLERLNPAMQTFTALMENLTTAGTLAMTPAAGVGGTGVYPTIGGGASWTMVRDFVSSLIQTGPRKLTP